MTEIHQPGFSLDLLGTWERTESAQPGSHVYREAAGDGTVTIMLLAVRPSYAIADRSRLLSDYMQHRSKFERGQVPLLEQSDPVSQQQGELIEGSWSAIDAESGRRQRHRVVLADDVLADFCYEVSDLDDAVFADRAARILGSAVVSVGAPDEDPPAV